MSVQYHSPVSDAEQPRGMADIVAAPEKYARYITNFRLTPENTLRAVQPPPELAPRYRLNAGGYVESTDYARSASEPFNGVFHARLDEFGSRDVTLAHYKGTIYDLEGWNMPAATQWSAIYGKNATRAGYDKAFPEDSSRSKFLTQFVRLPSGILVIPQGARAAVYDGYSMLYLGYDSAPGAPEPKGPHALVEQDAGGLFSKDGRKTSPNGAGYTVTGRNMPYSFGDARLGTIDDLAFGTDASTKLSNPNGGVLREGMIRYRNQWINNHGDLSPASAPSTAATWAKEDNLTKDRKNESDEPSAKMRPQIFVGEVAKGPAGTTGRIVSKTRDLINSGDPTFYEIPANSSAGAHEFATLPSNTEELYEDNLPESWLITPYTAVDPVPVFRLACLSMGRLWIANMVGDPGLVRASLPGRWGTFPEGSDTFYPDPTGSEVTAMFAVAQGMLVFTESSVFLMVPNDSGEGFQYATLSNSVGCVSPDSIATLAGGVTVWLSREGFHAWDGKELRDVSQGLVKKTCRRINPQRRHRACAVVDADMGEYRCWVPLDRDENNGYCFVFDGAGWRERTDMTIDAVCLTDDPRQYVLALGAHPISGGGQAASLWVIDRAGAWTREYAYDTPDVAADEVPAQATWRLRSHWLRSSRAHRRGSPVRIGLWLRESHQDGFRLRVFRDWRENPEIYDIPSSDDRAPDRYSTDDPPAFLEVAELGSTVDYKLNRTARGTTQKTPAMFRGRRPFWSKVDISVPSCEVFAFEIEGTGDVEFVGFNYVEHAHSHHGGNAQPGGKR